MSTSTKSKVNITPLGDRVLARRVELGEQTKDGIIIPDTAREKPQEAEIIALGSGKRTAKGETIAFEVKAGDRVLISKYGGTEVEHAGETYVLLREDDIQAILN